MRRRRAAADTPSTRRYWLPAAIVLLPIACFWPEMLGRAAFFYSALGYDFLPYHTLVAHTLAQGVLPLWNPYTCAGLPLLGDGQTAMFYPPNWLYGVLPPQWALSVAVVLNFPIAGAGMFFYLRRLRLGSLACAVGAIAYMFNGFLVGRVVDPWMMAGAALIPWVFWGVEGWLKRQNAMACITAAGLVALQALTGHPQVPAYTAVAVLLYTIVRAFHGVGRTPGTARRIIALGGIYALGGALSAIQLIPWAQLIAMSPRAAGAGYDLVTDWSVVDFDWLLFLFPHALGGQVTSWLQSLPPSGLDISIATWERIGYIGMLPLGLAMLGLCGLTRPRSGSDAGDGDDRAMLRALAAITLLMILVAAGSSTFFGHVVYALPLIGSLRGYSRAVCGVAFGLCALSGWGVERLARRGVGERSVRVGVPDAPGECVRPSQSREPVYIGAALLGLVCLVLLAASRMGEQGDTGVRFIFGEGGPAFPANAYVPLLLAVLSCWLLVTVRNGLTPWSAAALLVLVGLDLCSFAVTYNRTVRPGELAGVPPSARFLQRERGLFRVAIFHLILPAGVMVERDQLAESWAMPYRIEDINGFSSLQPRRHIDFLFGPATTDVSYGVLWNNALLAPRNPRLSQLDVAYALIPHLPMKLPRQWQIVPPPAWRRVYNDPSVAIYANPQPVRRAFFVDRVVVQPDARAVLKAVTRDGFDPRRQSYVEGGLSAAAARALESGAPAIASVSRPASDELLIHAATPVPRLLVLSEMWFPGWRAELEDGATPGRELPVLRVNYLFRGVVVPAGKHVIRMRYRPRSALLGALISALALLGCAVVAGCRRFGVSGKSL